MSLLNLPNEVFLCTSGYLETDRDINAFSRINRRLHEVLDTYLYHHNLQRSGGSGLWWAAQKGQVVTAGKFLEGGAEVDAKDPDWKLTPLYYAAENGHEAVVQLLLEKGAVVVVKEHYGSTSLSAAAMNGMRWSPRYC